MDIKRLPDINIRKITGRQAGKGHHYIINNKIFNLIRYKVDILRRIKTGAT